MTNKEQEYQEFILKLSNKAKEVREDFERLSPENQERIRQNVKFSTFILPFMDISNLI